MKAVAAADGCPACKTDQAALHMTGAIDELTGKGLIADDGALALTNAGRQWLAAYGCPLNPTAESD